MTKIFERRWTAILAALIAGAGAALAFPPFDVLPGLLGYGLLMVLLDTADRARPLRSAFWRGWLAGAAFFLISTWWISESFFVDAAVHGWQAPFAVGALAGGLGLFWGVAGMAVGCIIASQLSFPRIMYLPDFGPLNFGRLRPLHTSAVIFAFGGNALIATSNRHNDPVVTAAIRQDTDFRATGYVLKARGQYN